MPSVAVAMRSHGTVIWDGHMGRSHGCTGGRQTACTPRPSAFDKRSCGGMSMTALTLRVPHGAGNFTGAVGVAAELRWTDAAATASAMQMVAPDIRAMAAAGTITYESHHYGIWLPDFLCDTPRLLLAPCVAQRVQPAFPMLSLL